MHACSYVHTHTHTDTLTKAISYACAPSQQSHPDLGREKKGGGKAVLLSFPLSLFIVGLFLMGFGFRLLIGRCSLDGTDQHSGVFTFHWAAKGEQRAGI